LKFVAACDFATDDIPFANTRKKFAEDLDGALKYKRDGFIFMTNQKLTPGARTDFERRASTKGFRCLIYAREHLRVVLDSPQGYGLLLRHLGVGVSFEEQAAYFAASGEYQPGPGLRSLQR
jgi:hypothetical protein